MFRERFPDSWAKVDFHRWLHQPGECPAFAPLDTTLVAKAQKLADGWVTLFSELKDFDASTFTERVTAKGKDELGDFETWDAKQKLCFLSSFGARVLAADGAPRSDVVWNERSAQAIERIYGLDRTRNSEIRMWWCDLALAAKFEGVLPNVRDFLEVQGRLKFVRPLFRQLHQTFPRGDFARNLFEQVKSSYHTIARKMVERDLAEDQR